MENYVLTLENVTVSHLRLLGTGSVRLCFYNLDLECSCGRS